MAVDRETNLKLRQARLETNSLNTTVLLSAFVGVLALRRQALLLHLISSSGNVTADAPNNNLHKFQGTINAEGSDPVSVNNDNVLLRVCICSL